MTDPGELVVCATPIGNLGDVSDRLRETLRSAQVVYAEDTRRAATLLRSVGARPNVKSLFVGNESKRIGEVLDDLARGHTVALISEAGMPAVSDPGAETIRQARAAGYPVTLVPGPSAVTTAVAVSGFGADRFVFEGFLPRKGRQRADRVAMVAAEDRPVVLFVSPHRLLDDLQTLASVIGLVREIAVTRELTKLHEEIWLGTIGEAIEEWSGREPRGEFTVVIAPVPADRPSVEEAVAAAKALVEAGSSPSDAAREVAGLTGVSRRDIYEALIADQDRS